MWIAVDKFLERLNDERVAARNFQADYAASNAKCQRLELELAHVKATLEWFKHRLTQVEQERAQLIYAATGRPDPTPQGQVKIAYPDFVGTPSMSEILNQQNNPFGTTGEDSNDPSDQIPGHEDMSHMPGHGR